MPGVVDKIARNPKKANVGGMHIRISPVDPRPSKAVFARIRFLDKLLEVMAFCYSTPCLPVSFVVLIAMAFRVDLVNTIGFAGYEIEITNYDIMDVWIDRVREQLHLFVSLGCSARVEVNAVDMQTPLGSNKF